jgi:hypothetical protein
LEQVAETTRATHHIILMLILILIVITRIDSLKYGGCDAVTRPEI